ncbi:MAG: S41 family peptidase [Gammaproteobacteria bacterium]
MKIPGILAACACMAAALGANSAFAQGSATPASGSTGPVQVLARYPTVHNDTVVFEAGGNLWKTTMHGGVATRLTFDSGFDLSPHFSPNGRWIAFTGWYQGNTDVYVVPADGGPVRRLTFHSLNAKMAGKLVPELDNIVLGWTPNGKDVVFLSDRDTFNPQVHHAYEVSLAGGLPTRMPLPWTGPLSFNANGTAVAYNKLDRVMRPFHRKPYYGGQAQDVWIYNFKTRKIQQITHWKGADVWPMWDGDTIYFTSNRGANGVQNLWSYSLKTKDFKQLTHFKTFDVDWPSLGNDGIAFSDGGKLYVYQLPAGHLVQIPVKVPLNGTRLMPRWVKTAKMINDADIAPNGKLAVFSARGALYTVPAKYDDTVDLTHNPGADERAPAWSPDGKWIAYIGDIGSGSEVYVRPAQTAGTPRALTHTKDVSYQDQAGITWSPDDKWITYVDSHQVLWLENIASGKRYKIAQDKFSVINSFTDVSWGPHSGWIAFSNTLPNRISGLFLYQLSNHSLHRISEGGFNDSNPVFSPNGKYLFFTSARIVNPVMSSFDFVMASADSQGLYVTTLRKDLPSPFAPRSQSAVPTKKNPKNKKHKKSNKPSSAPVQIDLHGLMARTVQVPVPPANYGNLGVAKGVIYFTTEPNTVLGGTLPGEKPTLHAYSLKKRKEHTLADGVSDFALSADGSTLLYPHDGKWLLRPATFATNAKAKPLDLAHMRLHVEPRAEWDTIFGEAVRDETDYFINPKYVAAKWPPIVARYRPLLPLVGSRQDLNWIIANMIGSMGESHMYVFGGAHAWRSPSNTTAGLGATFALNKASGRYYLARIYKGDNSIPGYRAPLDQPGLTVKQGDYILAINGHELKAPTNPYSLLVNTYGTVVRLRLADNAADHHTWTIKVRPVANATKLHLLAWIRHNKEMVNRLSHGKIGYVYLEDMETTGMREFVRQYYSQLTKPGLIIDDRWNLGGFIDPVLFNRLDRKLDAVFVNRHGMIQPTPNAYPGHMAALMNRGSASDGDIFAYMFEKDHLGPTIGSRSWGGVRGYNNTFRLLDGGQLVVSENAMYGLNSQWVVENIGVIPDIKVHDEPGQLNAGHDAQIETAVKTLMKEISAKPKGVPPPPPWMPFFPPQPHYPPCPAQTTCG